MADGSHREPAPEYTSPELLAAIERMSRDPLWREPRGEEYRRYVDAIAKTMEEP